MTAGKRAKKQEIEVKCPKCKKDLKAKLMKRDNMFHEMGPYVARCLCQQVSFHDGKGNSMIIMTGATQ